MNTSPHPTGGNVRLPSDAGPLEGDLHLPAHARALVLFAHGLGSNRWSPRDRAVARRLHARGCGTLLFDLLTPAEAAAIDSTADFGFDLLLLARRLIAATRWAQGQRALAALPLGYFGSCTGGGAVLVAAAELGSQISAVVSRGGRPDLAGSCLLRVQSPTLLIAGGCDPDILRINSEAFARLNCVKALKVIPRAGHLFGEEGALDKVADWTAAWFVEHLVDADDVAAIPPA
ncbi:MAG: hypothetical protein WDO13_11910 [Verrucomicrobiota bacterium]